MKKINFLLIIFTLFLFGCPKDKNPDPQTTDREAMSEISLIWSDLPLQINCDTSFEAKKIKIQTRRATSDEVYFSFPGCPKIVNLRINLGVVMEFDVEKFKGIKKCILWIKHTSAYSNKEGSFVGLYDSNNNLINSKSTTDDYNNRRIEFTGNLENLKKVKIVGKAEVTDLTEIKFFGQ